MNADRYYLNDLIKIKRNTVLILKKMNENVLQKAKEHDYSFVSCLLGANFSDEELQNSTTTDRSMSKTAYARLDEQKYNFIRGKLNEMFKIGLDSIIEYKGRGSMHSI